MLTSVLPQPVPQTETVAPSAGEHPTGPWHEVPDNLIKYFPDDPKLGPLIRERLATFRISPQEAFRAALDEQARRKERGLETVRFDEKPVAVTDRCFVFAEFKWIGISLRGYYVDGQSGAVTWRENPDDVIFYQIDDADVGPRLKQRIASFKISPDQALKIALAEAERRRESQQPTPMIYEVPVAVAGRRYVFIGERKVPGVALNGIYVDGDTGHAEWREGP